MLKLKDIYIVCSHKLWSRLQGTVHQQHAAIFLKYLLINNAKNLIEL